MAEDLEEGEFSEASEDLAWTLFLPEEKKMMISMNTSRVLNDQFVVRSILFAINTLLFFLHFYLYPSIFIRYSFNVIVKFPLNPTSRV